MQTFRTSNRHPYPLLARAVRIIQPDYRLCRWCGMVWNIGQSECPPHLRSEAERRMAINEAAV